MRDARGLLRGVEAVLVGAVWTIVAVGLGVTALTLPSYTQYLVERTRPGGAEALTVEESVELAEDVRAFVASRDPDPLPATYEGVIAFQETAVAHLEDVRAVVLGFRYAAGAGAALLAAWIVASIALKRRVALARGIAAGGWTVLGTIALTATLAVANFERLFTDVHRVFFEEGTWLFPANSLLIQLFPASFWQWTACVLFGLCAIEGGVLLLAGRRLGRSPGPTLGSRGDTEG